jgi:diguanylate cyclase (GGDEF)-like protein/PAS domain S-box-containing protein
VSGRAPLFGFVALVTALTVACFVASGSHRPVLWVGVGLLSVAAIAFGVVRHRPPRQSAWWLVAAALLALTLSEAAHFIQVELLGSERFPSLADAVHLLVFVPLLLAGLWRLVRSGTPALDRAGLLDALIVTTAAAILVWSFFIDPLVSDPGTAFLPTAVAASYPVSGVLVLAMTVRLATGLRFTPPVVLVQVGGYAMLIASAAYGVLQLQDGWRVSGLAMLGWLLLFAGWGASALHPAMGQLSAPHALRPVVLTRLRLVGLAIAAVLAPGALLVDAVWNAPAEASVRRALVAALIVFLVVRLYTAVDHQLRGSARERGLRCASGAMVRATSVGEVNEAVRVAVRQLLPPGTPHEVVVEIGGTATPSQVDRAIHPLDSPLADQPGIPEAVLRCPLAPPGAGDDQQVGAMYVAADAAMLVELETSLDVVATQAATALQRIRLTEQVNQRASEEYFRTLVHHAADVILIVDEHDTIRYASPSAATVLGVAQPVRLADLIAGEDRAAVARTVHLSRADPAAPVTADWIMITVDGSRLQAEAICRDLRDDPTVAGLVVTLRDVTEQRRLQRELTHLAFHDQLTGLPNRALLRRRLTRALQCDDGSVVGLLTLDLDDLKTVNDTLGHAAGDELLVETGRRLARVLRPQDTAARVGGDEFAVLVEGAHSPRQVEEIAQEVVAGFGEPLQLAGRLIRPAVSVGVATTTEAADDEELLRRADLALYAAKAAGKGQWCRFGAAPRPALAGASLTPGASQPPVPPEQPWRSPPADTLVGHEHRRARAGVAPAGSGQRTGGSARAGSGSVDRAGGGDP